MNRRGVSLVELLIAITVMGILAAAMTRLLIFNSKADERTNAAREARGVSRSAMNLLETELRMAEPAGVISPTNSTTITFHAPVAFGVVCAVHALGEEIATLPSADVPSSLAIDGYTGYAWRNTTGSYVYEANTTISAGTAADCTANNITSLTADGGRVVFVPVASGTVTVGSVAFLYRDITYSLANSTTYPGRLGLFRTVGANGTPEELAAPFSSTSRFRWYILDNATAVDTLPTFFDDLRGIQFVLNGESAKTPRNATAPVRSPFSTAIFFQNRPN